MNTFSAKIADFDKATEGEIFDATMKYGKNGWMIDAVQTKETIAQFEESSATWTERSQPKAGNIAGMPFIFWKIVQVKKGEQRRHMCVVDFGDCRMVLDFDPTEFAD